MRLVYAYWQFSSFAASSFNIRLIIVFYKKMKGKESEGFPLIYVPVSNCDILILQIIKLTFSSFILQYLTLILAVVHVG